MKLNTFVFIPLLFCIQCCNLIADSPSSYLEAVNEPGAIIFSPPSGWQAANPNELPGNVKVMVVGKGKGQYPPSLNLGFEPYKGTIQNYKAMMKSINEAQGVEWKDLGTIQTGAGEANLSQVDMLTEWGKVRLMHLTLIKGRTVYVLTAAALKNEFHLYYKSFFDAMKSIRFNKDVFELVDNQIKRKKLKEVYDLLLAKYDFARKNADPDIDNLSLFECDYFQNEQWKPFLHILEANYADMSPSWKEKVIEKFKNDLTAEYK